MARPLVVHPEVLAVEFSEDSDTEDIPRRRKRFAGLSVALSLGLAGLFSVIGAATGNGPWSPSAMRGNVSAVELLEGRRLAEVVHGNLAAMESDGSMEASLSDVQEGMRLVSESIRERAPDSHRQLRECQLTPEQQDGLLQLMASTRDERVQMLGYRLLDGLDGSNDLDRDMSGRLAGQLDELVALRGEIIPQALLMPVGEDGPIVDPGQMHMVKSFKQWHMEMNLSPVEVGSNNVVRKRRLQFWDTPKGKVSQDAWHPNVNVNVPGLQDRISKMIPSFGKLKEGVSGGAGAIFGKLQQQAGMYVGRAEAYVKSFPQVYDVLFGKDYWRSFKGCAEQQFQKKNPTGFYSCGMAYASAAMEAMESVVGKKADGYNFMKGYGTTTPKSFFSLPSLPSWTTPAPSLSNYHKKGSDSGLMGFNVFR